METKLTLKLEKRTIEKGKAFAKKRNTSLSKIVENYLEKISDDNNDSEVSPLVQSLSGVVKGKASTNKADYAKYLKSKYK